MRRFALLAMFCIFFSVSLMAQVTDASVCDILKNPQSFEGKTVRIKGTAQAGFDDFIVKGADCPNSGGIWLNYPEGTKAKAGPIAYLHLQLAKNNPAQVTEATRVPIQLDKSKDFKQFDALLSSPYKGKGMCLGCVRYKVNATIVGRLDAAKQAGVIRDAAGKFVGVDGFGNLNAYKARLVIQSVADVAGQEIDYSKNAAVVKDDSGGESSADDPVAAGQLAAAAFPSGSAIAEQIQSAAAAYGAEGDDNGVMVSFGTSNEASPSDNMKGSGNSPDGLLLNCSFDMDRLKGDALSRAMSHVGRHIADIRSKQPITAQFDLEFRGWQNAAFLAVAYKQKTLTAPGGYLVWNSGWPTSENNKMLNDAINALITEWVGFQK